MQVPVSKSYPDHLSLTAWMCCIAAFQSGIITFFIEPDLEAWKVQSYQDLGSCFFAVRIIVHIYYYIYILSEKVE